ncbi:MAG TPA: response regulator transcription factor [Dehalococcoidales bacterium]
MVNKGVDLLRLLIIAQESRPLEELCAGLAQNGFTCSITSSSQGTMEQVARQSPDIVLVEMNGQWPASEIWELPQRIKRERQLPVIALVTREMLANSNGHLDMADDFIIRPCDPGELGLRVKRVLHRTRETGSSGLITCGDLLINPAKCEVTLTGRVIMLTFMEYELLKFLANNKGRVFTREVLLDRVWGYDYYGGDRTVDVHIRRLRSKIEDSSHTFIETVRNIGYRFREDN